MSRFCRTHIVDRSLKELKDRQWLLERDLKIPPSLRKKRLQDVRDELLRRGLNPDESESSDRKLP